MVKGFMDDHLKVFTGKSSDGVSTLMPEISEWLDFQIGDIADIREPSDHLVVFWVNLPTAGIVSATKTDFIVTFLANKLAQYKRNGVGIIVHSNRAEQLPRPSLKAWS